jgi:hypothetical protein
LVNGKLILSERDGAQRILVCDRETFQVEQTVANPFREFYGPRCLAYDGQRYLYQIGTQFSSGGGGLQAAYLLRLRPDDLGTEVDRMEIVNSSGGTINARGVEIDPRDGNYWVTDLAGNIYKIANFDTPSNPLSSVGSSVRNGCVLLITPNPARERIALRILRALDQNDNNGVATIELLDALGRVAGTISDYIDGTETEHTIILDCAQLPVGVYTAVLRMNGSIVARDRLVVIR